MLEGGGYAGSMALVVSISNFQSRLYVLLLFIFFLEEVNFYYYFFHNSNNFMR